MKSCNSKFLKSIHYLRGITIIAVVAGHCVWLAAWNPHSFLGSVIFNLIPGGTYIFVFVAGFLFHYTERDRFCFYDYLKRKVSNVISPYLVLSALAIALHLSNLDPRIDWRCSYALIGAGLVNGCGLQCTHYSRVTKWSPTGSYRSSL